MPHTADRHSGTVTAVPSDTTHGTCLSYFLSPLCTVLSAIKEGDIKKITSLLSCLDPRLLKEVLHTCKQRSCLWDDDAGTPLSIAVEYGHLGVVQLLVEFYKVDINQKVTDTFYLQMCLRPAATNAVTYMYTWHGKSPLYLACEKNNLQLARYLIENGANFEDVDLEGRTCLMAACIGGHHQIMEYLLETGAHPDKTTRAGKTALHIAIERNDLNAVIVLFRHRATWGKIPKGHSPLIEAAIHGSHLVVEFFLKFPRVSRKERIDALELMGARVARVDLTKAFGYLHRAMEERYKDPTNVIPKPFSLLPTLTNVQESQTLQELEARQSDRDTLRLECLAIVHRILGQSQEDFSIYYQQLLQEDRYNEAAKVCHAGYKYACQGKPEDYPLFVVKDILFIFGYMLQQNQSPSFELVHELLELVLNKLQQELDSAMDVPKSHVVDSDLWLCCLIVGLVVARGEEERRLLHLQAYRLVHLDPSLPGGFSVLHDAVNRYWTKIEYLSDQQGLPFDSLVSLLLNCGADVNALDDDRNTPLHIIASSAHASDRSEMLFDMTKYLLRAGAFVGIRDKVNRTPLDVAWTKAIAEVLRPHYPESLKSLTASAVLRYSIPFEEEIPREVEDFVRQH